MFEDEQAKQNQEQLSNTLTVSPLKKFPQLDTVASEEGEQVEQVFIGDDRMDQIVEYFNTNLRQILPKKEKVISNTTAVDQSRDAGYWFVLENARLLKFKLHYRLRPNTPAREETMYFLPKGIVFRNSYI